MFQLHSLLRLAMNSFSFKEFRACFSTLFAFLLWRVRQFRLAASILHTWKCLEPCIYDIISRHSRELREPLEDRGSTL